MKATYVSVWEGGIEVETSCDYDPVTREVTNVETSDTIIEGVLLEEYILLPTNEEVRDFFYEEEEWVNGQKYEQD